MNPTRRPRTAMPKMLLLDPRAGLPTASWWTVPTAQTRDGFNALVTENAARMAASRFARIVLSPREHADL